MTASSPHVHWSEAMKPNVEAAIASRSLSPWTSLQRIIASVVGAFRGSALYPYPELLHLILRETAGAAICTWSRRVMKDTSFTTQDWFCERLAEPYVNNSFSEPRLTSTWNAADLVHTTVTHPERGDSGGYLLSFSRSDGR